ncbi:MULTISPECIES: hypothetical protein [unclassified Olleya]|uniref:hypothetical protein n=1 Tax=unclassified Olleya TaxID=2615019 RepID=UPI0025F1CDA0|nr:hypothetical protein [Olleya sp. UBA1516]|tara:strand:+ start:3398 stop:3730 length:333 start_codon:yes stop_codon:yes gene_type:complete
MNTKNLPNDIIKWWESKRWLFNLLNALFGIIGLISFADYFQIEEAIGLVIYIVTANVLYSSGMLLEIADFYYFNNKLGVNKIRLLLLTLGLLFSCGITILGVIIHYAANF